MRADEFVLIVGAGPTGLTLAIELARRGFKPVIIDRKGAPLPLSRAVGINPRSLELLEASGVTERLLAKGLKLDTVNVFYEGKRISRIPFSALRHRYNFLLSLPQDETESIMIERLRELGVEVRWRTELKSAEIQNADVSVVVETTEGQLHETHDYVVGADGAHSLVREMMDIPFDGYTYDHAWSVVDIYLKNLPDYLDYAGIYLHKEGWALFLVPLGATNGRFRAVCTHGDVMSALKAFDVDKIVEAAQFTPNIRQACVYRQGPVFLAGDAAHVHSPAGGRGMNLGISDACFLARCFAEDRLDDYSPTRHPVGKSVLRASEGLVRMASIKWPLAIIRNAILRLLPHMKPLLRTFLYQAVSGLTDKG